MKEHPQQIQGASSVANRSVRQLFAVLCLSLVIASMVSHSITQWFGLHTGTPAYRRIGPTNGPQALVSGSSLLQFAIEWPRVSEELGQGMENWGVGGSTPEIWEVSQKLATNSNLLIIGVSYYDLNEYRLADSRAHLVPVGQTLSDLWETRPGWAFSKRVLSQYPLAYLRSAYPTAGRSDAVLVGLRRKLLQMTGRRPTADDQANSLVLPTGPVLQFGDSTEKLTEWPRDKALRRMALQKNEIQGLHQFSGPKNAAFRRMLERAVAQGRAIVVVLPVAPSYEKELITPAFAEEFEAAIAAATGKFAGIRVVRLDRVDGLRTDSVFSDYVHLNGAGKRVATAAFMEFLKGEGKR